MPRCSDVTLSSILDNTEVTETDVMWSISRLKINSSCGSDGLQSGLFKRLKYCLSKALALIYNQLMSVGTVTDDWHTGYIVPVFKTGTAGDTANYRSTNFSDLCS